MHKLHCDLKIIFFVKFNYRVFPREDRRISYFQVIKINELIYSSVFIYYIIIYLTVLPAAAYVFRFVQYVRNATAVRYNYNIINFLKSSEIIQISTIYNFVINTILLFDKYPLLKKKCCRLHVVLSVYCPLNTSSTQLKHTATPMIYE